MVIKVTYLVPEILEFNSSYYITAAFVILSISYWVYYRKYRRYVFLQKEKVTNGNKPRGKCPPFYPNGWYSLMNTEDLKINEVKHVGYCGRNIVLFRGTNNQVYALDAFCAHMGANLGFGGKVKHNQCIQCPFHGWLFDGETGNCVNSESLSKKQVIQYEYNDVKNGEKVDDSYLKKCFEGNVKLKKYLVKEVNNSILIWYDSRDEYQEKPLFEPLAIESKLEYRAESLNFVNCHIQEIPENGADIRHFEFLHTDVFQNIKFIQFEWQMKSRRASEPDIFEYMQHKKEFINEYKMKLMKKYINDENRKYLNIIYLDCHIKIFNFKFFFFNLTGFQLGPSLVYLFLKSAFFEVVMAQSVTPMEKFNLKVSHKMFTNSYIPYWLSAYMIYSEVKQLFSDMNVWNNKNFGSKLNYNLKTEADKNLLSWRNWYAQFYEGCHNFEKNLENLDW